MQNSKIYWTGLLARRSSRTSPLLFSTPHLELRAQAALRLILDALSAESSAATIKKDPTIPPLIVSALEVFKQQIEGKHAGCLQRNPAR